MTVLVRASAGGVRRCSARCSRTPAFREREVERLKAERLAELLQLRAEPRGLADEMFSRFVYDAGVALRAPRRR